MTKRRVIMTAIGTLIVIAVASTSALVTLTLVDGGPSASSVAAPASASVAKPSKPQPSESPVASTRPASSARTTMATATVKPNPPPAARVPTEAPTDVQITHWGVPSTPPQDTVTLAQGDSTCASSLVGVRQDAVRCFTTSPSGGVWVLDPCFDLSTGQGLMCPSAPWSSQWIMISAQGTTGDTAPPSTQGRPWGVEVASGVRCREQDGAGPPEISGLPKSYSCTDGSGLYGDPSRGSTWHIEWSPQASNGSLRSVALIGAWY